MAAANLAYLRKLQARIRLARSGGREFENQGDLIWKQNAARLKRIARQVVDRLKGFPEVRGGTSLPSGGAVYQTQEYRRQTAQTADDLALAADPIDALTTSSADKKASWFDPSQLLTLLGDVAKGYSGYEKSRLQGRLMAMQMAGKPLQVTPLVEKGAKEKAAAKIPWGWLVLGVVVVGGLGMLAVRPRRPAIQVLPPAPMALPRPRPRPHPMALLPAPA